VATGTGGRSSTTPHTLGVDGGDNKNLSQTEQLNFSSGEALNAFKNVSLKDITQALTNTSQPYGSNGVRNTGESSASDVAVRLSGFPALAINQNPGNYAGTGGAMSAAMNREPAWAASHERPQQRLMLDSQSTKDAPVLVREDGARITYQSYTAADKSTQTRIATVSGPDGTRTYSYDNPTNPGMATKIIDNTNIVENTYDSNGVPHRQVTPVQQIRQRDAASGNFTMQEYNTQTGQLVRAEVERSVQTRQDGQLIYQRYLSPEEIDRATKQQVDLFGKDLTFQERRDLRKEIAEELSQDRTWLVANDLPSSKRALLTAASGKLFGGDNAKTERYIDMYITRIRDWRQKGYATATDDQLAFSLRRITDVFTKERTGAAASMSDTMRNHQVERALMGMGSPGIYNNQGQVGTCYVNSYRMAAEYMAPHLVLDKWASIMTTGKAKGRSFNAAELKRKNFAGEDSWNYVMNSLCAKFRYGSKYSLRTGFPGTAEFQAQKEFRLLTDGGKLPLGKAAHKKYGVKMAYTYGGSHAQCWVGNILENTWNGMAQKKTPKPHVETLVC